MPNDFEIKLDKRLDEIYDLVRREHIGQSSFGVILEVRRRQGAGESLALKVLQTRDLNHLQECLGPKELQKRGRSIQKEITFLSDLEKRLGRSPGDHYILPLLDAGLWSDNGYDFCEGVSAFKAGFPAFVMPKGLGLSAMVSSHFRSGQRDIHPVGPLDLLRWTLQIATALSAVHSVTDDRGNRFMHRDIKPSNLLLVGKDLYVIDFGIVKAPKQEGTGSFMGSEKWMAPERVIPFGPGEAGRDWDLRFLHPADLYSLGLVLYWMVTVEENYAYLDSQVKIGALLTEEGPREDAYLKRGKLGGMNDRERKRLKARLHTLFNVPKTVEGTGVRKVADKEPVRADVAAGVYDLIEQLLAIEPDQRPTAETVIEEARRLIQLLIITEKPTIEAPSHAGLKTPMPVTVRMEADWVPEGTDWLEVTWGGQKAQKIESTGPGQYTVLLPGLEKEGRYEVCSAITLEGVEAELPVLTVQVSATADQLWAMGQYAQALIREPDREEWLTHIRNETRDDGKKCCEWVEVLEAVYHELQDKDKLRKHKRFSRLFSRLDDECDTYKEADPGAGKDIKKDTPKPPFVGWKRRAGLVVLLVLLAGLGLGYGLDWDWRKYSVSKPEEPRQAQPELPKRFTNFLGQEFVYIKPGTFWMGSPSDGPERDGDEPRHKVTLSKGFYLQTTEVTQGQWKKVMGSNPSFFKDCGDNCPVETVSWEDAQEFICKLNRKEGKKYRLPTEAEWEYACRAGTQTPFSFGGCLSTDQANYDGDYPMPGCGEGAYREKPVSVKSFSPNAWGLYNMHGNVWEWCEDWHGDYDEATDPEGPSTGSFRVFRGGSWYNFAGDCRSANRYRLEPGLRYDILGFRLAFSPGQ
ncbi:MAG: SUMF1/EgtB/PvdO family nonheme iron enzyme [Deltaproteobacteria bacterium]|nr:SUMF1/EgtB/PvdO family nonheme iron enzyme [Deltaproteobacteria bacterium]